MSFQEEGRGRLDHREVGDGTAEAVNAGLGLQARGCWQAAQAGTGRNRFHPRASGGSVTLSDLDVSPVKLMVDFGLQNCERINVCCVRHPHCGALSQQLLGTNTLLVPVGVSLLNVKVSARVFK